MARRGSGNTQYLGIDFGRDGGVAVRYWVEHGKVHVEQVHDFNQPSGNTGARRQRVTRILFSAEYASVATVPAVAVAAVDLRRALALGPAPTAEAVQASVRLEQRVAAAVARKAVEREPEFV